ncbi:unnamed protein product [Sympodiomycopsis kandeliae]
MATAGPSRTGTASNGVPMPTLTSNPIPPAYLAPPFISSKALGENTSIVEDRPNENGGASGSGSRTSPATSTSSPRNGNEIPTYLYAGLPRHLKLPDGTPDYLRLALSADIYDVVKTTPLQKANKLSAKLGCEIFLKREDLQPVFSFKLRGAYNLMRTLEGEQRWKGVIACSAGNHAQGVSLSGLSLSIPCTIVMPLGTPSIKVDSVRALGAKVVLHGQDFDEAKAECSRLAETYGLKVIPPFDDPHVIAGQATVAVEILRQTSMDDLDGVFCCVGGGGLLAGVSSYVKRIAPPNTKVIGVETFDGDALTRSLQEGKRVTLKEVGLFADGTAVKIVGDECWRILRQDGMLDGMVRVDTDEICAAIRDTFEDTRTVPEPSGALSLAGLKRYILHHNLQGSGKKFACVVSGANMNFSRLRFVAERAEVGDGKEVMMMVEIPETPGSFMKLHSHIHPRNITEFSYRYNVTESTSSDGSSSTTSTRAPVAHIYLSFYLNGQATPPVSTAPNGATGINGFGGLNASHFQGNFSANALASNLNNSVNIGGAGGAQNGHEGHAAHVVGNGHAGHAGHAAGFAAGATTLSQAPSHVQGNPVFAAQMASTNATAGSTSSPSSSAPVPPSNARDAELQSIMDALASDGMRATDISTNEMAKSHGRYLVGGRQKVPNERLFRFEFPERPGALRKFLIGLNAGWNISLFHYRNHGSDVAKILAGVQVPEDEREAFEKFLSDLGYVWTEETNNEVAQRFL